MIDVDRSGRANAVRIYPAMLVKPDDPVTTIPQPAYHAPVRELLSRLEERVSEDIGVILFGSVARGTANRTSDIDLFVVVEEDRIQAQREAYAIEQEIAEGRFGGERYEAHIIVEPRESAAGHDQIGDIFAEGLTLRDSPAFDAVKQEVFDSGAG